MNTHIGKMIAVGMMGCFAIHVSADTSAARKFIQQNYFKPLPKGVDSLPYAEFDKLLDKWTWIVPKDRWDRMNATIRGEQKGRIGITIDDHPLGRIVTFVDPGAPAYYSGLMVGDVIQSVNGEPVNRPNAKGEYPEIRGKGGVPVMLEILRGDRCINIFTQRADFHEAALSTLVDGRTLALKIGSFTEGLHKEFIAQTSHLDPDAIDTIIIDLRDNGGGLVNEALAMLSEFINGGDTLLSVHYRDHVEYETADSFGRWYDADRTIIVVQNKSSASASEIMSGTLKARAEAIIVGEQSYGKGRMQRMVPRWYMGSADTSIGGVILTIAQYRAGGLLEVDERGVAADVPMTMVEEIPAIPEGIDVTALRLKYEYPTYAVIDSIVRIGGAALADHIWSSRGAPFVAMHEVRTMRHALPKPAWRCIANHDTIPTMFSHDDEQTIRKVLVKGLARSLPDSVQRIEPLESLLQHIGITPHSARDAQQHATYTSAASVLHRYGVRLRDVRGTIVIDYVIPASSAYRAGICVGDRIMSVYSAPITGLADVLHKLATTNRQHVQLDVRRGARQFPIKMEIDHTSSAVITVVHDQSTAYIGFGVLTMQSVQDARDSIEKMDEIGISSLILDLRGVDAGNAAAASELVGFFTRGGAFRGITPIVVVDNVTRGAAEYVAYTLQQSGDATIVGTTTAGDMVRRVDLGLAATVPFVFTMPLDLDDPTRRVVPDHTMSSLSIELETVRAAAALYRDVTQQRTSLWHATEITNDHLERQRNRLPEIYRDVEDGPLAEAIYGSVARYYQLQPVLRMLRGGPAQSKAKGITQR